MIEPALAARLARDGVYIIDCNWEYFVVVGSEARSKRREIMLSLTISTASSILPLHVGRELTSVLV